MVLLFALGCATSGVESTQRYTEGPIAHPPIFLIYDFATSPNEALVQAYGSEFASPTATGSELASTTARALSAQLQKKLTEYGIHARRVDVKFKPPVNAMVLKGEFLTLDEGSRLLRMTIGFGAGATHLRVRAHAYQAMESGLQRIAEAEVKAQGDKMPGMAVPVGVGAATGNVARSVVISGGMNVAQELTGGLDEDAGRIADEIAERVKGFYESQGWL
jgi:hypothetical protein